MGKIERIFFERPKNTGFRHGFISLILIAIALIFPVFYSIGSGNPLIQSYQNMMIAGLVMSIFFSSMYRNMTKTGRKDIALSSYNITKQMMVLTTGVIAGLVLVMINIFTNIGVSQILTGSAYEGFYLGLLAGIAEELFFRGFIQTLIRLYVPVLLLALVPSALIFTLFHYFAYQSPVAFMVLFVLGIFLGILHEMFNDIGVPMLAHIVNNTFAMLPMVMAAIMGNMMILFLLIGVVVVSYLIAVARSGRR